MAIWIVIRKQSQTTIDLYSRSDCACFMFVSSAFRGLCENYHLWVQDLIYFTTSKGGCVNLHVNRRNQFYKASSSLSCVGKRQRFAFSHLTFEMLFLILTHCSFKFLKHIFSKFSL